jgi:hypothetical protein
VRKAIRDAMMKSRGKAASSRIFRHSMAAHPIKNGTPSS